MRISLSIETGSHKGKEFFFDDHDFFIVGRSSRAHLRLLEKDGERGWFVSRTHFLIEMNPPRCRLLDLRSRNGTFVNGARVKDAELRDGDEIRAGRTLFRVRIDSGGELSEEFKTTCTPFARPTVPEPYEVPVIGKYRMVRELGRGGMGVVYLAEREDVGQVAIKVILPTAARDDGQAARFLREAHILQELDHPHIVAFREAGKAGERLFFVMDYVPGVSAAELLAKEGPLPVPEAVGMACQLLEALEYAHERKLVHRDIKPENVLVTEGAGRRNVKLADFGLARVYQASQMSGLTVEGALFGTLHYMPPEQVLNFREVTPLADQYSAAATLYRLLTHRFVYDIEPGRDELIRKLLEEEPVPIRERRPELPAGLAKAIDRALEREPAERHADAEAFRRALLEFAR